ncbi:hypothetical protein [Peribacillus sp. SCS-155]|uniref:hypothetical protein n=1 Tax=Peribacillus sedimenti TaxID=3115297 RepID=UPI003905CBBB
MNESQPDELLPVQVVSLRTVPEGIVNKALQELYAGLEFADPDKRLRPPLKSYDMRSYHIYSSRKKLSNGDSFFLRKIYRILTLFRR